MRPIGAHAGCHCEEPLRRSNPVLVFKRLDCFASLAMTAKDFTASPRNYQPRAGSAAVRRNPSPNCG
ncbi:MAG: hypothetical protein E6Q28_03165 [Afipia sp.]|nr:MAG: hypothetical protein E6Q28_03165 [Afipia sp.]